MNMVERNIDWKKLMFKRYNDFLKVYDSACRIWNAMMLPCCTQRRMSQAMKYLGDLWQHYCKLQGILRDCSTSEKWMR